MNTQKVSTGTILRIVIPVLVLLVAAIVFFRYTLQPGAGIPTPTSDSPNPLAVPGFTTPVATPTILPDDVIRLAWFYKPPDETQFDAVARNMDFFILTHKDEQAVSELRGKGVQTPMSLYLLFLVINDPGDCDEEPNGNQVAYKTGDFCEISESHPDWFLLDEQGNRIRSRNDSYYMDPGSEGYRAFWLERARELQETYGWDNIFLDNVEASRTKMIAENGSVAKYPDDASYQRAVEGFLAYIRANYFEPRHKPIYGNVVSVDEDSAWERYVQYLDGVMLESFATDWSDGYRSQEEWEGQMHRAEKALAQGKTLLLVAQGDQEDNDLQNFAFASYLLLADGNAFFRYTNSDSYRDLWLYENYDRTLGRPLGPRHLEAGVWRREFVNGVVTVDPKNHKAEITWNP